MRLLLLHDHISSIWLDQNSVLLDLLEKGFVEGLIGSSRVYSVAEVARDHLSQDPSHISFIPGQLLEYGDERVQLGVVRVVVPRNAWQGVLRLEEVRVGGVVDDDDVFDGTTQPRQVLNVEVFLELGAVLAVKASVDQLSCRVKLLKQRFCIP